MIFTTGDILYPRGVKDARFPIQTADEATAAAEDARRWRRRNQGHPGLLGFESQAFARSAGCRLDETRRRQVPMFAYIQSRRSLQRDRCRSTCWSTPPHDWPRGSELVARMKAANIALIPTLKLWRFELVRAKQSDASTACRVRAEGVEQLREYFSAGGPILFGTDVGYMTDFSTLESFEDGGSGHGLSRHPCLVDHGRSGQTRPWRQQRTRGSPGSTPTSWS